MLRDVFTGLPAAVRKGGTNLDSDGVACTVDYDTSPRQHSEPHEVLDIPADHGLFWLEISKTNPKAKIVAREWENVLTVAKDNAAAAGVRDRDQTIVGSAFDAELDRNYGLRLLTNFLHHLGCPNVRGPIAENLRCIDGQRMGSHT